MPKRARADYHSVEDVNDDDDERLRRAVLGEDYERVQELLRTGDININLRSKSDGKTPFRLAFCLYNWKIVQLLIDHGAIAHGEDAQTDGLILRRAAREGDHVHVKGLLEKMGVDVDSKRNGWTALHYASYNGHLEVVRLLIEHGADVRANNKKHMGWTSLHFASYGGHSAIVRLLVKHGANLHAKNKHEKTPFHHACENGHLEVVKFLFENGGCAKEGNDKDIYGHTPLHSALGCLSLETMKFLIVNDSNLNAQTKIGDTVLHRALWCCRLNSQRRSAIEIIRLMVKNDADLNVKNNTGRTPVHRACDLGHLEAAKLMIESGADLNLKDMFGKTPLHRVCDDGHVNKLFSVFSCQGEGSFVLEEITKLLIKNGANLNAKDHHGDTPLHLACLYGRLEISKLLIENGADTNAKNNDGYSPLYSACEERHLGVVQLLLSRGANVNVKTTKGKMPLQVACNNDHLDIVWSLVRQHPCLVSE